MEHFIFCAVYNINDIPNKFILLTFIVHCVKSVGIRFYSGPHFPTFGLNPYSAQMQENADQNNSEYGHFSQSGT